MDELTQNTASYELNQHPEKSRSNLPGRESCTKNRFYVNEKKYLNFNKVIAVEDFLQTALISQKQHQRNTSLSCSSQGSEAVLGHCRAAKTPSY